MFAERFGWTPSVVKELDIEEYQMLLYAIEEVNNEQEKLNTNNARGGSSMNGQNKVSSMSDLINYAESRRDCTVIREDKSCSEGE